MPREILAPTTGAVASAPQEIFEQNIPAHFFCAPALAGGETATLQISADDGATWVNYSVDGLLQQITDTNTGLLVIGAGRYRINKGTTAGATGVYLAYENEV